jgi:hypothetical protein
MKLFEVAISLADVILCLPLILTSNQLMQVGPRDILHRLVAFLTSFRGGDPLKLQILHKKMYENASILGPIPEPLERDGEQDPGLDFVGLLSSKFESYNYAIT